MDKRKNHYRMPAMSPPDFEESSRSSGKPVDTFLPSHNSTDDKVQLCRVRSTECHPTPDSPSHRYQMAAMYHQIGRAHV